ncbi:Isochorismate synthase entC [Kluyvera cryocrescens]|uniref:Isochorismate synthase entC n=1 Tax=Kluyvera cryocrescens TaxID=580 RepID=A0A485CJ53_KLUCR|nr:Isochorismate synthase entC [Kluyvera cryocrescens]
METSLAAETQQQQHQATIAADSFFFMSPFRSFTTSGCFTRFTCPAEGGDLPDSAFQQGVGIGVCRRKSRRYR